MKSKQDAATLAEEFYNPSLSEYYKRLFDELIKRLAKSIACKGLSVIDFNKKFCHAGKLADIFLKIWSPIIILRQPIGQKGKLVSW